MRGIERLHPFTGAFNQVVFLNIHEMHLLVLIRKVIVVIPQNADTSLIEIVTKGTVSES